MLHSLPIGHMLDGVGGISDPRGMLGRQLGVDAADNTDTLCVRATFDADADNSYQAKGVQISLRFDAEQVVNNTGAGA